MVWSLNLGEKLPEPLGMSARWAGAQAAASRTAGWEDSCLRCMHIRHAHTPVYRSNCNREVAQHNSLAAVGHLSCDTTVQARRFTYA